MDGTSNLDLFTHEPLLKCGFVSPFNSFGKLASHKRCLVVWTVVLHASRKRTGSEVWTNKLTERVNRESLIKHETDKRNDRMSNEGTMFERSKTPRLIWETQLPKLQGSQTRTSYDWLGSITSFDSAPILRRNRHVKPQRGCWASEFQFQGTNLVQA